LQPGFFCRYGLQRYQRAVIFDPMLFRLDAFGVLAGTIVAMK
jgi:hypothetical protein